jgi:hypothetical protein
MKMKYWRKDEAKKTEDKIRKEKEWEGISSIKAVN